MCVLTDPLKPSEIELLKFTLPENMNVDAPAFRKQVQTCLHGALVRTRDASLSNIRCIARNDRISPNGKTPDDVQASIGKQIFNLGFVLLSVWDNIWESWVVAQLI